MGLPMTKREMTERGWEDLDFLFISGDAYVDHPSFSTALICRWLEHLGYRVGIIAQPDWTKEESIQILGKPRLATLVSAGNLDSMLCHYTAAKNRRTDDKYSPDGKMGLRPDRAVQVYSKLVKKVWPDMPVVIGGVEASLRRFAHYDYWADNVMPSILIDSQADILIYGMGERAIQGIAENLASGIPIGDIQYVPGTCFLASNLENLDEYVELAPLSAVTRNKKAFASAFRIQYWEQDPIQGQTVVQSHGDKYLVQLPPAMPLGQSEMDELYSLPFTRMPHPSYKGAKIPATEEVLFSITSHRGCFGSCSFCAISSHQGRIIQNRSQESILAEAKKITQHPDFKGYIHDVGGPSANFRQPACEGQEQRGACKDKHCIGPEPCPALIADHQEYMELLRKVRALPRIKKVFIRSGIRYDYLLKDPKSKSILKEIVEHHVSGQLKVAPEHVSKRVLDLMGKPGKEVFLKFKAMYEEANKQLGLKQFLVPYLISSHPGATIEDAVEMSEFLRDIHHWPEQVQDFIPTPGSLSTAMYWTELNPLTGEELYVARNGVDKIQQRVLLQPKNPKNRRWVLEALRKAGREDLIGRGAKCLVSDYYDGKKPVEEVEEQRRPFLPKNKKGAKFSRTPLAAGAGKYGKKSSEKESEKFAPKDKKGVKYGGKAQENDATEFMPKLTGRAKSLGLRKKAETSYAPKPRGKRTGEEVAGTYPNGKKNFSPKAQEGAKSFAPKVQGKQFKDESQGFADKGKKAFSPKAQEGTKSFAPKTQGKQFKDESQGFADRGKKKFAPNSQGGVKSSEKPRGAKPGEGGKSAEKGYKSSASKGSTGAGYSPKSSGESKNAKPSKKFQGSFRK